MKDFNRMRKAERVAALERVCEELVKEGLLRVVGVDDRGRKRYVLTEHASSPHFILDPSQTKQ